MIGVINQRVPPYIIWNELYKNQIYESMPPIYFDVKYKKITKDFIKKNKNILIKYKKKY